MVVQVLLFGGMARAAGKGLVAVELDGFQAPSVRQVLEALGEQHAVLRFALGTARLAVNGKFASDGDTVSASDEVALIALVGGG